MKKRFPWIILSLITVIFLVLLGVNIYVNTQTINDLKSKIQELEEIIEEQENKIDSLNKTFSSHDPNYQYLCLGNSITLHGVASYWWDLRGMAATEDNKDYYHQVCDYLTLSKGQITSYVMNYSAWETQYYDRNQTFNIVDDVLSSSIDLVSIQLGENASNLDTYKRDYIDLINHIKEKCPNAQIIVIGDFWEVSNRDVLKKEACLETNVDYVSLEATFNDSSYRSSMGQEIYSSDGTTSHFVDHEGVANHPGDKGMKYIADEVIKVIK